MPLAPEKQDGPAEVLTFLGIEIDTIRQELRLPAKSWKDCYGWWTNGTAERCVPGKS